MTSSQSDSVRLKSIASRVTPALLTTTSRLPKVSTAAVTRRSPRDQSPTSPTSAVAWPPASRISAATVSAAGPMSFTTTAAPWAASARASARPSPSPAPVTTAVRPDKLVVGMRCSSWWAVPLTLGVRHAPCSGESRSPDPAASPRDGVGHGAAMPIDLDAALDAPARTEELAWTERDVLLYHLSLGAGRGDEPELAYTYEGSRLEPLRVLPTFA